MTRTSRRKSSLVALTCAGILLVACARTMGSGTEEMEVNERRTTLWELIERIGDAMPLSKAGFERALGVRLQLADRTESAIRWTAPEAPAIAGAGISAATLLLGPSGEFDASSAAALELGDDCVDIAQARLRYPSLKIIQAPRGRSTQETTVFEARHGRGRLQFAVQESKAACIVRVSFRV